MTNQKPFRFKFFLPDARLLSKNEIENLSADKTQSAAANSKKGIWIEIACTDRSCIDDEGRITLPVHESKGKGFFLNLFCPEDSCEIVESTDLP